MATKKIAVIGAGFGGLSAALDLSKAGHEDHTGAIRHVLEEISAPIYSTPLTQGMLEVKLARSGMNPP